MADGRLRELERRWRAEGGTAADDYDVAHHRAGQGLSEPRRAALKDLLDMLRIRTRTVFVAIPGAPGPGAVVTPIVRLNGVYLGNGSFYEDYAFRYERGGRDLRIVLNPRHPSFAVRLRRPH